MPGVGADMTARPSASASRPPAGGGAADDHATSPRPRARRRGPVARFRLRVTTGDTIAIGPGKIDLLEAIVETQSITAAARSIGMSYRRAWILVDQINACLRQPAVTSAKGGEHGGGSRLTAVGEDLIERYRRIEARAAEACAEDIEVLLALVK
jgi:molybdate transport system regulatory protein